MASRERGSVAQATTLDSRLFESFKRIVYERSGIALRAGKEALVSARIGKRMRTLGLTTAEAYLSHLLDSANEEEFTHLIDAITTNVTGFYREPDHFDFLSELVTTWLSQGQRRFRVWCGAASTGEEPYTLAITLLEALRGQCVDAKILATDISTQVLGKCLVGKYPKDKTKGMPPALLAKYFDSQRNGGAQDYTVKDIAKRLLTFRRLNLAAPPFPMRGPFDVIFIRNVMIYFDDAVRGRLLNEAYRLLKPGGYLMVGHAESLTGMVSDFKSVKPSIYLKAA